MENRYIENFQIIVDEAHVAKPQDHSVRWNSAVNDMRRIHPDLPDVAIMAAQKLPAADPAMLASRLSNAAPREIAGIGKENLNNSDLALAVRRTHRSITMQEAAGQIVSERDGIRKADDFLSLKAAIEKNSKQTGAGLVAIETLKRQGIDARRLLEGMKPAELKAVSVGAFDRVGEHSRDRLNAALEVDTGPEERAPAPLSIPTMRSPRPQLTSPRRQPSFGRKMASIHAMQQEAMSR
jgi:hypothetical protein